MRIRGYRERRLAGFTLIEMLGVVLILSILLSAFFGLFPYTRKVVERKRGQREIELIRMALEEYHANFGVYPPTRRNVYERRSTDPLFPPPDMHFKTGLTWYLYHGPENHRWKRFLARVHTSGGTPDYDEWHKPDPFSPQINLEWTNNTTVIIDPWFQEYHYEVGRDYQSYVLWSSGPPGDPDGAIGDVGFVE